MARGKVPDGYVDKRRFEVVKRTIEQAEPPFAPLGGMEVLLEPKRTIAHRLRQLYFRLNIVGVTVSCPNNHDYILVEMEEETYRKDHPKDVREHYAVRRRLFQRLKICMLAAYPCLDGSEDFIRFKI